MWFTIKQFASIFSELVINHFLVLWTTVPIALCIWGMASLRRSHSTRASLPVQRKAWNRSRAFHGLRTLDWVVAVTFLVFLGLFVYSTMHGENFANYDESQLTNYSIQGKTFRPPIWPDNGRFFPLANQEFNLLKYVTQSPEGYHAFALLQLGLMFVPLLILLQEWQLWGRLLILMSLMVTPSIMISFSGLIYPERNVLFCLAILLAGIQGLSGSHRRICLGIGLLAAHFALYYKEPVFLFLSAFAGTQLLSSWFVERETQERSIASFLRKHVMEMGLIALACLFLIFYAGTMLPHPSFSYASHFPLDRLTVLALYLKVDALLVLFLSAAVLRFVYLLWTRTAPDRFWDSLCVGGVAYFLGFMALGIFSGYYMAPVDLVATLYLSHLVRPCFCRQKQVWAAVTALVVALAVLQNVAYSSFRMIERKNVISGKGQLAAFLIDYARSARERPIDLFFPFAEGFVLGELSSFF